MPNVEILLTAKAENLDQFAAVEAKLKGLDAQVGSLGASVNKTTGELKVHGAAQAETATEAQALADKLQNAGIQVTGFRTHQNEAKESGKDFEEAMHHSAVTMGMYGEESENLSRKLGGLQGLMGFGGMGVAALGATAALGIGIEVVKSSVEEYAKFGEEVLNLQRVTGMSAESSSRLVDVFGQLGISSETADNAMLRLGHSVEQVGAKVPPAGKTLAELGVEIGKSKDGSVDLEATLFNVADAYNASGSAAERDAIVYAAFGRAGAALIPVLEQGSVGLRAMADASQRVFDQQQLEQVHRYTVQMAAATQEISRAKDLIGGPMVDALGEAAQQSNDMSAAIDYANRTMKLSGDQATANVGSWLQLYNTGVQLAEQSRKNAEAAQEHTAAMKQLDDAIRATEADSQALLTSDNNVTSAQLARERASQSVANAQKALADETLKDSDYNDKHTASLHAIEAAQDKLSQAVAAYGPKSDQAAAAQDALNKQIDAGKTLDQQNSDAAIALSGAQLTLKDAMLADSQAAVILAEKQAELSGGHLNAVQAAKAQADELQHLKDQAGGVLPAELQTLLDKLNDFHNVHVSVTADVAINDPTGFWAANHPGRQHGGDVEGGKMYLVGESGPEWLAVPPQGGHVYPHGVTPPALTSVGVGAGMGQGASTQNTYNIQMLVPPAANLADIGRETVRAIQEYERRAGKAWRS